MKISIWAMFFENKEYLIQTRQNVWSGGRLQTKCERLVRYLLRFTPIKNDKIKMTKRSVQFDERLIRHLKSSFEEKTGWGSSEKWTNQDFLYLSEWIQKDTGIALSHVTLKRFWGKVRYDSNPSTYTMNTLVRFLGYKWWRDFWNANASRDNL